MNFNFINKPSTRSSKLRIKSSALHKYLFASLCSILVPGLIAVSVSNVSAVSSWDNSINTTPSLTMTLEGGAYPQNVTSTYASVMSSKCPAEYSSLVDVLGDPEGRWAITQADDGLGGTIIYIG